MTALSRSLALCALLGASASALAQAPAAGNLVANGDFAKFVPRDNLWDGVDSNGFIAGWPRAAPTPLRNRAKSVARKCRCP